MGELILILGGARSGKSRFAVELAKESRRKVTFVATCVPRDGEMRERLLLHQRDRPKTWTTIEEGENLLSLFERGLTGTVIIDCLTLYLSNLLLDGWDDEEIRREVKDIIHQIKDGDADCIVVSNEVGMGIVPETYLGRRFRDLAGRANQMLAGEADEVYLIAAGIPLKIKGKGD